MSGRGSQGEEKTLPIGSRESMRWKPDNGHHLVTETDPEEHLQAARHRLHHMYPFLSIFRGPVLRELLLSPG